ncbi:MAG: cytidylate kinase-like family protein [Clostridia bacterium]|nr:cytidylate kinase-like family protein [Clostridia bacterium]MBO7405443.1 cytidylate kinase-like family protein [Clostridia bacterium]
MANCIVTIARQYGSGGREVGRLLSERTGWKFYDKDLITLAAQKSGLSSEALQNVDEKAANSLLYTLALGSSIYNHGLERVNLPINDRLFVVQSEIIKELAATGEGAIIVGRCADYVLAGRENLVKVYITADFDARVKTVMERHELSESAAKDLIVKTDKRRANYYSYYTGEKWGRADKYDLVISTDRIGIEGAASLICDYITKLG